MDRHLGTALLWLYIGGIGGYVAIGCDDAWRAGLRGRSLAAHVALDTLHAPGGLCWLCTALQASDSTSCDRNGPLAFT